MSGTQSHLVHATTVVINDHGVLIRGVPGSGKSHFALSLIRRALQAGLSAKLVADDQTALSQSDDGKILATCPDAIAGRIEVRPWGIVECQPITRQASCLDLVCDLLDASASTDRVQQGNMTALLATQLPHLCLPQRQAGPNCSAVFAALGLPCWY